MISDDRFDRDRNFYELLQILGYWFKSPLKFMINLRVGASYTKILLDPTSGICENLYSNLTSLKCASKMRLMSKLAYIHT